MGDMVPSKGRSPLSGLVRECWRQKRGLVAIYLRLADGFCTSSAAPALKMK